MKQFHSLFTGAVMAALPVAISAGCSADTGSDERIAAHGSELIDFPEPLPTFPWPEPTFEPPPPTPPSCAGRCGGMGGPPSSTFDPCSCVAGCQSDGTCCGDYATVCSPPASSCFGFCGGQAPGGCWCDAACSGFGDCCSDEAPACDGWPRTVGGSGLQHSGPVLADGDSVIVGGAYEGSTDFGGQTLTQYPGDTTQDGFVAKYSQSGALQWVYNIRGPQQQWVHDVAVDGQGFVYAVGSFWNTVNFGSGARTSAGFTDAFLVCLSPGGSFQWVKTFGGPDYDSFENVVAGDRRWAYVSGIVYGGVNLGGGALPAGSRAIAAFDWNGTHRWSRRFDTGGFQVPALALDRSYGDLIVADSFVGTFNPGDGPVTVTGTGRDIFVAYYDYRGVPVFPAFKIGSAGDDTLNGLAVDDWGQVFLSGTFTGTLRVGDDTLTAGSGPTSFVASLDAGGHGRWAKRLVNLRHVSSESSYGNRGLALDRGGNVWLAGSFETPIQLGSSTLTPNGWDSVLLGLTNSGAFRAQLQAGGAGSQFPGDATGDRHGRGYLSGHYYTELRVNGRVVTNPGAADWFVARSD